MRPARLPGMREKGQSPVPASRDGREPGHSGRRIDESARGAERDGLARGIPRRRDNGFRAERRKVGGGCHGSDFIVRYDDAPNYILKSNNGSILVVSRGLARESTPLPRFFNRPEIVILEVE